jgi:hypothetical protein
VSDDLQQLIADLEQREIVCPLPIPWNTMFNLIDATKKLRAFPIERGPAVALHNPLILGGWGASDAQKWHRFTYHLREADKLAILPMVNEFLAKLEPKNFLCARRELSDISVWDLEEEGRAEVDKIMAAALPAVSKALEFNIPKRHHYDPKRLYQLFSKHGFFSALAPTLTDAKHLQTVEALRQVYKAFEEQAKMIDGRKNLDDFCSSILELRIRLENE